MTSGPTDLLTRARIRDLTQASDLRGGLSVASDWAVIVGTFVVAWAVPQPVVWLGAVIVLGSRQLALAVLMHECAHHSLFRTRWVNDRVVEHHLLPSVPHYRLAELHAELVQKDVFDPVNSAGGYLDVMRTVTTPA